MFNERVQQRFPAGTPVKGMVDALDAQGFEIQIDMPNRKDWAVYEATDWVCNSRWYISWQSGADDKLVSTEAHFGASCL